MLYCIAAHARERPIIVPAKPNPQAATPPGWELLDIEVELDPDAPDFAERVRAIVKASVGEQNGN